MNSVYLDNAATTALDERVLEAMLPYFKNNYGNPSSIHGIGRNAKLGVEEARKKVAGLLGCKPAEVFFTSCGTESTNTILYSAIRSLGCTQLITSPIEHHATLYTAEKLCNEFDVELSFCKHQEGGEIDYEDLSNIINNCSIKGKTIVSIMHANNEIGIINDINRIGNFCKEKEVLFHSDMVQTIGHMDINLEELPIDFASASAHKFHGPKGNGLLYVSSNTKIEPLIVGGGQERNLRAGTEDVAGIVGFAKALELAIADKEDENKQCLELKQYCWESIHNLIEGVQLSGNAKHVLPRVLSLLLPLNEKTEMLQMSLDIKGIAVSGGSACSSGAMGGSHVINHLYTEPCVPLRISFCKWNNQEDANKLIQAMKEILL